MSNFSVYEDNMEYLTDFGNVFYSSPGVRQEELAKGQEVLEPTPIAPQGIVVVENLPIAAIPWHGESPFLDSLKSLLNNEGQESSLIREHHQEPRKSASFCDATRLYNQARTSATGQTGSHKMTRRWSEGTTPIGLVSTDQLYDSEESSSSEASARRIPKRTRSLSGSPEHEDQPLLGTLGQETTIFMSCETRGETLNVDSGETKWIGIIRLRLGLSRCRVGRTLERALGIQRTSLPL
jgi:hypothetical protein